METVRRKEAAVGLRPRGILSGFLVIVPGCKGLVTFIPPAVDKATPFLFRVRLHPDITTYGCILSAYRYKGELVIEDVLVWREDPVFYCKSFPERWALVRHFFDGVKNDPELQGVSLVPAVYRLPSAVSTPDAHSVAEWVPFEANQRRLILVPAAVPTIAVTQAKPVALSTAKPVALSTAKHVALSAAKPVALSTAKHVALSAAKPVPQSRDEVVARKDPVGPDVYQLWRGATSLGQALVRTLGVSKALRLCTAESIPVSVAFHKGFSKWEVVGVL
jgi:hypothetical protein